MNNGSLQTRRIYPRSGRVLAALAAVMAITHPQLAQAQNYQLSSVDLLPTYRVTLTSTGVTWLLEEVSTGYRVTNAANVLESYQVGMADINASSVNLLSFQNGQVGATLTIPASGAASTYGLSGAWNPAQEQFSGQLFATDGTALTSLEIEAPGAGSGQQTNVVVIVVVSALAIVGVACHIVALLTDCGGDCKDSCEDEGRTVGGWEEGWCGRCRCECTDN